MRVMIEHRMFMPTTILDLYLNSGMSYTKIMR